MCQANNNFAFQGKGRGVKTPPTNLSFIIQKSLSDLALILFSFINFVQLVHQIMQANT